MADAKDVATVIQSALDEIGVAGDLKVMKDGKEVAAPLTAPQGDPVKVAVVVEDAEKDRG